jgi:phosphohistidine phosphatase
VIRHAKAEPYAAHDIDRSLTERGLADAAAAGRWLAEQGVTADVAVVSAATRTRQTWAALAAAAGWQVAPEVERSLYGADEREVLDRLSALEESATTAVVVGHNPTMHALAAAVDDGEGDADGRARLASSYPTSAVSVFDLDRAWADLGAGTARLRAFHVGRG